MNKIKVKEGQIWVNADTSLSLLVTRVINDEIVRTLVLAPKYFGSSSDPLVLFKDCELEVIPSDGPWRALCITDGPILVESLHQYLGVVRPETLQAVMAALNVPCAKLSKEQCAINALYLDMLADIRGKVLAKISE